MRHFVTLTVVGNDNPFTDTENQTAAYDHARHHGAAMATGLGKPLIVEHTLENPTHEQIDEKRAAMEKWLEEITAAAKVAAAVKSPFNGRVSIPGIGR